ncbi:MAG TPA: hypothetical protein VEA99_06610 [Gemmatimonadaceae bacterium]|nr:hypothetical protein [Gemmatimonadaceae bacterium]
MTTSVRHLARRADALGRAQDVRHLTMPQVTNRPRAVAATGHR